MNAPRDYSETDVSGLCVELRRWARKHLDAAALEAAGTIPSSVLDGLASLGLFGLTIPERDGGAGLGLAEACVIVEELARHDRSVATTIGLHTGLGTQAIVRGAKARVARVWLPRLARGEAIGAFAATEPNAGSDLMSIRATVREDGSELRIDGEKSYVTNAHHAGCYTVLARSGERAHSLVLVPRGTPGVTVEQEEDKLGLRASSTATVRFDGARVPRDHVLGELGRGLELAYEVLAWGRTLMSAGCAGTSRAAFDATLTHVTTRRQFRRALIGFPAVQIEVATMAAMLDVTEAMVERTAHALDEELPADALSFATKVFASESAFAACDAAIQLHGALGVIEPIGVARLARDCRVTRIFEGANDVLLLRLGTQRLASGADGERIENRARTERRDAARRCDRLAETVDLAIEDVRQRLGFAAVTHQGILMAFARAEMAHHAAIAIVLHPREVDAGRLGLALTLLERDAASALAQAEAADALAASATDVCASLSAPPTLAPRAKEAS